MRFSTKHTIVLTKGPTPIAVNRIQNIDPTGAQSNFDLAGVAPGAYGLRIVTAEGNAKDLDEDSQRRLTSNPLRILDSKSVQTREILVNAPSLAGFIDTASREHFARLCELLEQLGIEWTHNAQLVRGLDYYTHTVFEWVTTALGAQGTICAGGRYDGLVELIGGKPTPGAGFALGLERVILLTEDHGHLAEQDFSAASDVYCCVLNATDQAWAMSVAANLRQVQPNLRVRVHAGGGKLKNQLRRTDLSGASWALIIGEDEVANNQVTVKSLRDDTAQRTVAISALAGLLK